MTARRAGPHDDGRAAPLPPSGGKRSLDAVALTTSDGLLSAGKGKVDLDELSALGAGTKRTTAAFWDDTMHVTRFDVRGQVLERARGRSCAATRGTGGCAASRLTRPRLTRSP